MTTNNFDCYLKLLGQEIIRRKALGGRSLSSLWIIETFFKLKIDNINYRFLFQELTKILNNKQQNRIGLIVKATFD